MNKIMKISLAVLAALTLLISCATVSGPSGADSWRLTSFSIYDGGDNLIQNQTILYNSEDKPSEIIIEGADGSILQRRSMNYSSAGKLLFLESGSGESVELKVEYSYDESDYLVVLTTFDGRDNVLSTLSYINDDRGNPVEWISKGARESQALHFLAEYDDENRIIRTTEIDSSGEPIYYSRSEYDGSGNELSYTIYSPEGMIDQQLKNHYIEDALVRSDILDEKGEILYSTVYEVNDMGNPVLISHYNQYGDRADYQEIEYDEAGLERERRSFDFEGNLREKIVREYDDHGNQTALFIYGSTDEIHSISRNTYENKPLQMDPEEFNSLVFQN